MTKKTFIIYGLQLAVSLSFTIAQTSSYATRLNAQPLPHEREEKDFSQAQEFVIGATRFKRRPDYREEQALKKQEAEEAKQKVIEAQEQARLAQIENYKKNKQTAIDSNNKAVAAGKAGRWAEAIALHEAACQYDPENRQFRINFSAACVALGQEKKQHGDFVSASGLFRKAIQAAPDNALAGKLLAEALSQGGHDPASADVRLEIGEQLLNAGDISGALIEYQAALSIESSAKANMKMGDLALRSGQLPTATSWYQQAIIKDPDFAPAHRQLGFLAASRKDLTQAAASLRKAAILDPKDQAAGQALVEIWRKQVAENPLLAENHLGLAGAYQLTGDFAAAEAEYGKLEALDAKNSSLTSGRASLAKAIDHTKAEKHKLAAQTLYGQGLRKEALAEISQAAMLEPRNASYQFLLGECLEATGDFQAAHQAYLTCVLIDPENNKEAAARMKSMQSNLKSRGVNVTQNQDQLTNDLANKLSAHFDGVNPDKNVAQLPKKNMFEGVTGTQATSNNANAQAEVKQPQASAVPAQTNQQGELASQIAQAESQKNYAGAVALLRFLLASNLQNADTHHRLALNLLASGQAGEALSEFRIASALAPTNKTFASDLAKAMVAHKQSVVSANTVSANTLNADVSNVGGSK
jgi:tetratricopeptide (TPR) repeat protein